MRRLAGECEFRALAIELSAPLNQLLNPLWPFFHQDFRCLGVYQSVAGVDGVLQMQADLVFVAEGYCDSTLGILRI